MLKFVLIYEVGAIVSWVVLMMISAYVLRKELGYSYKRIYKEVMKGWSLIEILKIVPYAIIWPACFIAMIVNFTIQIRALNKLRGLIKVKQP